MSVCVLKIISKFKERETTINEFKNKIVITVLQKIYIDLQMETIVINLLNVS
jgi:hypothetical protein